MHILLHGNILVVPPKSSFASCKDSTSTFVLNISQQYLCDNFIIFNRFIHNFKYYNQFISLNVKVNINEILNLNQISCNTVTDDNLFLSKRFCLLVYFVRHPTDLLIITDMNILLLYPIRTYFRKRKHSGQLILIQFSQIR
jgi:hypothetical protein